MCTVIENRIGRQVPLLAMQSVMSETVSFDPGMGWKFFGGAITIPTLEMLR